MLWVCCSQYSHPHVETALWTSHHDVLIGPYYYQFCSHNHDLLYQQVAQNLSSGPSGPSQTTNQSLEHSSCDKTVSLHQAQQGVVLYYIRSKFFLDLIFYFSLRYRYQQFISLSDCGQRFIWVSPIADHALSLVQLHLRALCRLNFGRQYSNASILNFQSMHTIPHPPASPTPTLPLVLRS